MVNRSINSSSQRLQCHCGAGVIQDSLGRVILALERVRFTVDYQIYYT